MRSIVTMLLAISRNPFIDGHLRDRASFLLRELDPIGLYKMW